MALLVLLGTLALSCVVDTATAVEPVAPTAGAPGLTLSFAGTAMRTAASSVAVAPFGMQRVWLRSDDEEIV